MSLCHYSLLQYQHSLILGERLNVGVVMLFPAVPRAILVYPRHLKRLSQAYPKAPLLTIRQFLHHIAVRLEEHNRHPELFAAFDLEQSPESFIESVCLIPDDSALQFTQVRQSLAPFGPDQLSREFQHIFLSAYEEEPSSGQHDEHFLTRSFRQLVKKKLPEAFQRELIKEKISIKGHLQQSYHFDFGWQNGSYNLVKAISFDVKRPETIQRKTERYFGQLTLLRESRDPRNYRFDLLLSRPTQRNLFRAYDRAINILQGPDNVKIVEETDLDNYVESAVHQLGRSGS